MGKTRIGLFYSAMLILSYAGKVVSPITIEELKPLNYEVDILKTPIKKGEEQPNSIFMKSKFGQDYSCLLPVVENDESSKKESIGGDKNIDIKDLLKPIQSGSCLLKVQDWWTYEFCPGFYIKQFHIEDGHILGQVITLGLYESDYDWTNETNQEKFKHVSQPYHSQWYVNGTKCDLTGQPRNAEVRMFCEPDAGDYIYRVDEHETCSYIITIHTSRICSYPQLKPIPAKKSHSIPCHPVLNEEQYNIYMQKLNAANLKVLSRTKREEKELADQKRSEWLNNQQERLEVMKIENSQQMDNQMKLKLPNKLANVLDADTERLDQDTKKLIEQLKKLDEKIKRSEAKNKNLDEKAADISSEFFEIAMDKENANNEEATTPMKFSGVAEKAAQSNLISQYDKEIENLKAFLSPEKLAKVKASIQEHFAILLNEAEEDPNPELSAEAKEASFQQLTATLNMLLRKLDRAEKGAIKGTEEFNKAREILSEPIPDEESEVISTENNDVTKLEVELRKPDSLVIEGTPKVSTDDHKQTSMLDDDELHVRIRRLDRRSTDGNGKLYEMDFMQRKKLEQAVKEKLEKSGLDTGGRRIEVKIITAGYYENDEGNDFHTLSDEETSQFQNMIMALLTGQQEAVQEMEKHKQLEENYRFNWEKEDEKDDQDD